MWLIKVVLMKDKKEVLNSEMQDAEVPTLTKRRSEKRVHYFSDKKKTKKDQKKRKLSRIPSQI